MLGQYGATVHHKTAFSVRSWAGGITVQGPSYQIPADPASRPHVHPGYKHAYVHSVPVIFGESTEKMCNTYIPRSRLSVPFNTMLRSKLMSTDTNPQLGMH